MSGLVQSDTSATGESIVERDASGDGYFNVVRGSNGIRTAGYTYLDVRSKTATFTVDESSNNGTIYLCDTTSGSVTVTLPAAASSTDKILIFKKTVAANSLILDGNASETIDGATTKTSTGQYALMALACDGTNWHVIGVDGTWS
jgi:hypothetical protein